MDFISDVVKAVYSALVRLGESFLAILPGVVAGIIFIAIGYALGWIAKRIVIKALAAARLNKWIEKQNLSGSIGHKDVSVLCGDISKWYIFLVFLKQAVEFVNLSTLNMMLGFWINFALSLLAAIVVVVIGLLVGRYARNIIDSTKHSLKKTVGLVIEVVVVYIAVVMGLNIIGLPTGLLESVFLIAVAGVVLVTCIVLGLSFGLALKGEAASVVKELRKKM
jgi:hypothetical protein